jgi:hypothetical protein
MRITIVDRLKLILVRDRHEYWWDHLTDEEKELARMDVWELAGVIEEANARREMERKRIVAEDMLDTRLARI